MRNHVREVLLVNKLVHLCAEKFCSESDAWLESYLDAFDQYGSFWRNPGQAELGERILREASDESTLGTRLDLILYISEYWELQEPRMAAVYELGVPSADLGVIDAGTKLRVRARAEHIRQTLDSAPTEKYFANPKELFEAIYAQEQEGRKVLLTGLPIIGVRQPPVYNSSCRRKGAGGLEQKVMERFLGFTPEFFEAPLHSYAFANRQITLT